MKDGEEVKRSSTLRRDCRLALTELMRHCRWLKVEPRRWIYYESVCPSVILSLLSGFPTVVSTSMLVYPEEARYKRGVMLRTFPLPFSIHFCGQRKIVFPVRFNHLVSQKNDNKKYISLPPSKEIIT